MNRIFIGFDSRQPVSYTILQHSIFTRTDEPVAFTPLCINQLPMKREGLTPFTYSRFIVPHLCDYQGWALFLDIDMLVLGDISELFALKDESCAVMVAQNKMRFEWASVMLFNCGHPDNRKLTPEFIDSTDMNLHKIEWTEHVGMLPPEWNHLVGYDEPKPAKLLHYTQGIPVFPETQDGGHLSEYLSEAKSCMFSQPWATLMGNSVHAKPVVDRLVAAGKAKISTDEQGRTKVELMAAE